jgi:hypothetical protein
VEVDVDDGRGALLGDEPRGEREGSRDEKAELDTELHGRTK